MSPTIKIKFVLLIVLAAGLVTFSVAVANGYLVLIEAHQDGVDGVDGLNGIYAVEVSPDDKHVYTVGTFDDAISWFTRDLNTGKLTYGGARFNGVGGVNGLDGVRDLVISPDGNYVYTAGLTNNAVAVFSRNATTGALTFVEMITNAATSGAIGIDISPDGMNVYTVGLFSDTLAVFSRNASTGRLTLIESHTDGLGGVNGLDRVRDVVVSPDGKSVYTAAQADSSGTDDAVAVFSRNQTAENLGKLTFVEVKFDGVGGVDGLGTPQTIKVSPDGNHVYVNNEVGVGGQDWIAVFSRNTNTSALSFVEFFADGAVTGCTDGISDAGGIAFRENGAEVVVSSTWRSGLYRFSRDSQTGHLTYLSHLCTDILSRAFDLKALDVSSDDHNIYGTAFGLGYLSVFAIDEPILTINYPNGAPGSFFTIEGHFFPPLGTANISINGNVIGDVPVDLSGSFLFILNTDGIEEGRYYVSVQVNPTLTVSFILDASAPPRAQEGAGTVFNVPDGIALTNFIFLPTLIR